MSVWTKETANHIKIMLQLIFMQKKNTRLNSYIQKISEMDKNRFHYWMKIMLFTLILINSR